VPMKIVIADLEREAHRRAVVALTGAYARDPMGNGAPLPLEVLERLPDALRAFPTTLIFLAYDGDAPIGIATCFLGFSTFAARPLVNVHDLAVLPERRGAGVAAQLLAAIEARARELGCCKVTLEVLENNHAARRLYHRAGYAQATYTEAAGGGLFYAKPLK
jgi:GNAT superfamily N-acetyltransferase